MSGVGKGTATAAIGKILQSRGYEVTAVKIDPYINVDAGTMNPIEHGEVFVTNDGMETDQDIGNYERFLNRDILSTNYMTTGSVYESVIHKERNLFYNGKCVEVVPHIPQEVIQRIKQASQRNKADIVMIEIGGTVGEYQNLLFLEAARMLHLERPQDVLFILVSYLPIPSKIGEMKTKPTQYAARTLNSAGIQPDFILARSRKSLDEPRKQKISTFCNIEKANVISAPDIKSIYEIPLNFEKDNLSLRILKQFSLPSKRADMRAWKHLVTVIKTADKPVKIGIVGKYFGTGNFILSDAYISVIEAVKHACWHYRRQSQMEWLNAEKYEKNSQAVLELKTCDGIIVPGGFGSRGVEGKIAAIKFCRTNRIPYLGLCYGMQLACIEFSRNVCGLADAHTTEIQPKTKNPVIDMMPDQKKKLALKAYGGTMRLGAYNCRLIRNTRAQRAYGRINISERHRHRYELNNAYRQLFEKKGLVISGVNPEADLVEIIELKNHPFFVGTQFHPEFKSRPLYPHPLFREFIKACS